MSRLGLWGSACSARLWGREARAVWGWLLLPADKWRVTLFRGDQAPDVREDVKRNDPFRCGWLCLFASSLDASSL